jgi:predicted anti-sigma-YlaC factor YlaD
MNCKGVQPLLSAYLDRELGGDEMLDIRTHLRDCRECRAEAENLKALKRLLVGMESPEPPAYLEEKLIASVMRDRCDVATTKKTRVGAALMFAGVAACSMFATLLVINNTAPAMEGTTKPSDTAIAREITRDQVFGASGDPFSGAPVITAAAYGGN